MSFITIGKVKDVKIDEEELVLKETTEYKKSHLQNDCNFENNVKHMVKCDWMKLEESSEVS